MSVKSRPLLDGVQAMLPLTVPGIPFGVVFGVFAAESTVDAWVGWASSWLIFAGSAQLAAFVVIEAGGAAVAVLASVVVINARHLMYSAALRKSFTTQPLAFRLLAPYLLTDQCFATTMMMKEDDDEYRRRFFIGSGLTLWTVWNAATTVGILSGNIIPEYWELTFAVPLNFVALLAVALTTRPAVVAAVVGGGVAVALPNLPNNAGLLIGATCGIISGGLADRFMEKSR